MLSKTRLGSAESGDCRDPSGDWSHGALGAAPVCACAWSVVHGVSGYRVYRRYSGAAALWFVAVMFVIILVKGVTVRSFAVATIVSSCVTCMAGAVTRKDDSGDWLVLSSVDLKASGAVTAGTEFLSFSSFVLVYLSHWSARFAFVGCVDSI